MMLVATVKVSLKLLTFQLKVLLCHRSLWTPCPGGILLDAKAARDSWLASLRGIMHYFIAHPKAEESMPAVHQIFDWVDGFNKRDLVSRGGNFSTRHIRVFFEKMGSD